MNRYIAYVTWAGITYLRTFENDAVYVTAKFTAKFMGSWSCEQYQCKTELEHQIFMKTCKTYPVLTVMMLVITKLQ